jgi:hypothetical protein
MSARLAKRIALCALLAAGCVTGPHGAVFERDDLAGPAPWTDGAPADAPEDFSFVVVTDRTGEHREGVFEEAVEKINLLRPAFVVSVGDLIEGYSEDRLELAAQWDEFQGFVERLDVPFFYAPGNHDYSNPTMAAVWRERFGPSYYHFRYKDVLFLVLNSELFSSVSKPGEPVAGPDTQAEQLAFAQRVLETERDARFTFVLIHQPLWDRPQPHPDWLRVEEWLGTRPYLVFAGHFHSYTKQVRNDRRFITLATTGGGSRLRGADRGEFDHVAHVRMSESGPVIANLMLEGIAGEDVRTEAHREAVRRLDRAIALEPVPVPARGFRQGELRFRVKNEGTTPLELHASFEPGPDLVPSPPSLSLFVEPGADALVPVRVRAQRPLDLRRAAPALARWQLAVDEPGGSRVEAELQSWLLPDASFECPRARRPVLVDGRLGEWPELPFAAQGRPSQGSDVAGPEGGGFRFGVSHDDDFVYLAVDVTDPTPWFDAARSERKLDAVSVTLDARPDPARSANEHFFRAISSGAMKQLFFAWLVPGEAQPDPIFGALMPAPPEGALRAVVRTAQGYAAELAIPRAFLDERQGGPWQAFRLEISQQDFDAEGATHVAHAWRPTRFGTSEALPIPGSGTFVRGR